MKKKLLSIALSAAVVFTFSFGSVGSAFAVDSIETNQPIVGALNGYDKLSEAVKAGEKAVTLKKDITLDLNNDDGFTDGKFTSVKDIEINLNDGTIIGNLESGNGGNDDITITGPGKVIGEVKDVLTQEGSLTPKKLKICKSTVTKDGVTTNTFAVHNESPKDVKWTETFDKYGDVISAKVTYKAYCENCAAEKLENLDKVAYNNYLKAKTETLNMSDNVMYASDPTKNSLPDCESGKTGLKTVGKTISTLKDEYNQDVVISKTYTLSAKHNFTGTTHEQPATCITQGYEQGVCLVCNKDRKNILPATGKHKYGIDKDHEAVYDFAAKTITVSCLGDKACTATKAYNATLKTDTLKQQKVLTATVPVDECADSFNGKLEKVKYYGDLTTIDNFNKYNGQEALAVTLSNDFTNAVYTGKEIVADDSKKDIKVEIKSSTTSNALIQELEEGVDYTVSYENNVNATPKKDGKTVEDEKQWAQVVITGKGDFSGTIKKAFKIEKGVLTAKDSSFGGKEYYDSSIYGKNHEVDINGAVVLYLNDEVVTDDAILNTMTVENLPAKNAAVGKYKVTVKVPETDNYSEYSGVLTYNVRPADLLVKIQDASRAYGKANPKFEFTTNGLVSGDNIDDLVKITTKAKKSSKVGKYNIVGTVLDSDAANNYNITFDTAKLTVTKATQAITKAKTKATVKKGKSFKIAAKTTSGKVSYKKVSGNKKITVNKYGKVTAKKAIKKGTYKIKVKITAPSTANYKAKTVTKTITVKVK